MWLLRRPISASERILDRFYVISMEFPSLSRRRSFARNVPIDEERGETDVFASYIQRPKIKRKSYPWCKDYGKASSTHFAACHPPLFVKRVWGKCFKLQKNTWWLMMSRGYQHNLKDKLQSEINKTHRNRSPRSWNKTEQGRKRNVAFRDTIPALSVYCKRSFNGKVESHTKPTATLLIF